MVELAEQGESLILGLSDNQIAVPAATISTVYDMAILSTDGTSSLLDDTVRFPYYTRNLFSLSQEVDTLYEQLVMFSEDFGLGWSDIALISTIDQTGIEYTNLFIERAEEGGVLNVVAFQQVLFDQEDVSLELDQIVESGARIIVTVIFNNIMNVLEQANEKGLVSESHIWTTHWLVQFSMTPSPLLRGMLTVQQNFGQGAAKEACYREAYAAADPNQYFGAGGDPIFGYIFDNPLDVLLTAMIAADTLDGMEMLDKRVPAEAWTQAIRNVTYDSIKTTISFTPEGNRNIGIQLLYAEPDGFERGEDVLFLPYAEIDIDGVLTQVDDIIWFSNTTEIPDLDIRPPFGYWSCDDGEEGYDETGKTISLHTPDGSDIDDIDIVYHCDLFIDCHNLADETKDCATNYTILYIVFGIVTVLLMMVDILLIVFVIVFGTCMKYQRVRVRSPYFLLILLVSILIGYASVFAFYGKPHPVACGFQAWLLGLPVISMIAVLSSKNFRVYRIFRFPLKRVKVTNGEVFLLWLCAMIPALIILTIWMIVSTPTARMEERDGEEHYICTTGGFTGEPGGIIFFSIFVAYSAIILLIGAVVSILARNIPSSFNETKLLTISIYNLGFLAAVIIPVFLVVQPFNPFIAWILRTVAVL